DINKAVKKARIKGFNFVRLTAYEDLLGRIAKRFIEWTHKRKNSHYISMIR
ncbi:hypothetical protein D1AOALGA4SA_8761, partial [Olavius algarvensis Delta 1 endosymbiont]